MCLSLSTPDLMELQDRIAGILEERQSAIEEYLYPSDDLEEEMSISEKLNRPLRSTTPDPIEESNIMLERFLDEELDDIAAAIKTHRAT